MAVASGGADESTATVIANQLRESIITGELEPGSRLRQQDLARKYEASRMPIREALQRLESEGLVSVVAHSGAWVASLDLEEFQKTYQLRNVVEPFALEQSILGLTARDKATIQDLCDQLGALVYDRVDVQEFLRLDRAFHLATYAGLSHEQLESIIHRLWNSTQPYRRALVSTLSPDQMVATHKDHEQIVDAILREDGRSAGKLIWVHIQRTMYRIEHSPEILG